MERITIKHVEARCENVNRRLEARGSLYRWEVQGRNGHVCLDRIRDEDGATLATIRVGSKREISDFLHAAIVGMDDLNA